VYVLRNPPFAGNDKSMKNQSPTESKKRGPDPERVKIEGMDWTDAVAHALQKPMPVKTTKRPKSTKEEKVSKG